MKVQVVKLSKKLPLHKFSWMKYKGAIDKVLVRNVDGLKTNTTLAPNGIFGYRTVKQTSTGKQLMQIVVQDALDTPYYLNPLAFTNNILIHSEAVDPSSIVIDQYYLGSAELDTIVKNFIMGENFESTIKALGDGVEVIAKGSKLCVKGDNNNSELLESFLSIALSVDSETITDGNTHTVHGLPFEVTSLEDRIQVVRY